MISDAELARLEDDQGEGEFLAWLLPFAVTMIVVGVIRVCTYFGWLQ